MNVEDKYKICRIYWIITLVITAIYVGIYEKDFWNYLLLKEKGEIVSVEIQAVDYKRSNPFFVYSSVLYEHNGKKLERKVLAARDEKEGMLIRLAVQGGYVYRTTLIVPEDFFFDMCVSVNIGIGIFLYILKLRCFRLRR